MADVDPLVIEEMSWLNTGIDADIPIPVSPMTDDWRNPITTTKSSPIAIPSSSAPRPFPTRSSMEDVSIIHDESDFPTPLPPMTIPPSITPPRPRRSQRPISPTHALPISQSAPSDIYIPSQSTSPPIISPPKPAHRSEWLYRRPNYPRTQSVTSPPPNETMTLPLPPNQPHTTPHCRSISADHQENWSLAIRPTSKGGRSIPILETSVMRPSTKYRRSSVSSVSSSTNASTSSRPETPSSPVHRGRYRHPGPSKSILTRTSSNATKSSSLSTSCNKSVKFVEVPTIHHASVGYWDVDDDVDMDSTDSCIREDDEMSVDMDADADSRISVSPRSPSSAKKTKRKTTKIGKFLLRKSSPTLSRPSISGPFALGSLRKPEPSQHQLPPLPFALDGTSIRSVSTTASLSRGSSHSHSSSVPLRPAPSLESFRSVRSTGARSTRSLGSVRSTGSTGKFRSWLARMGLNFRAEMGCAVS